MPLHGQGDKVAQVERPAGALVRLNGSGARGDAGDGPGQRDGAWAAVWMRAWNRPLSPRAGWMNSTQ